MPDNETLAFRLKTAIEQIRYLDSEDHQRLMEIVFDLDPKRDRSIEEKLRDAEDLRRKGYISPRK